MQPEITAEDIIDKARHLSRIERDYLQDTLDALDGVYEDKLTDFEHRIVDDMAIECDIKRTAKNLGYKPREVRAALSKADVQDALTEKLLQHAEEADLTAVYVRKYVKDILDLSPVDYYEVLADGRVVVDFDTIKEAPREVKRLIESIETRYEKRTGECVTIVKFVSKAAALALAAKYTLVEEHTVNVNNVPWAEVAGKTIKELPAHEAKIDDLLREADAGLAPTPGVA